MLQRLKKPGAPAEKRHRYAVARLPPVRIWFTLKLVPEAAIADCRRQARSGMDAHKPKLQNYHAAAVFNSLRLLLLWAIWRWLAG